MSAHAQLALLRPVQPDDGDEPPAAGRAKPLPIDALLEHPEAGLTPARAWAIFRLADEGYLREQCVLFDGILQRHPTARQLFDGRRAAVAGKEWSITADGTDGDAELAAAVLDDAHRNLRYGDLAETFDHQLTHVAYGFASSEIEWGLRTFRGRTFVVPVGYLTVPHRRFCAGRITDELRLVTAEQPVTGESLAPGGWWVTRAPGRVAAAGLMRPATWLTIWSALALRDWLVKMERFGIPMPIAEYDPTVEDAGKSVAMDVVKKIGTDCGAAVPRGIKVEFAELKAGAADAKGLHAAIIDYSNRELAKLVVGGTLSTDSSQAGQGSYAQAEVHALGRHELVQGDANHLQRSWGQQVAVPFMRFNSLRGRAPLMNIQVAYNQSPDAQLKMAERMREMGVGVSQTQLRQITGLKAPLTDADAVPSAAPSAGAQP